MTKRLDTDFVIQSRSLIQSLIDHPWKPNPASEWRDEQEVSNQEREPK